MATKYKDIEKHPGYRVGDDGSVWSCWTKGPKPSPTGPWRVRKPTAQKYGHQMITFRGRKWAFVHTLVLEAFVGPCPPDMECRHKDGNAQNNRLENLVWGTAKENSADRILHGTQTKGEAVKRGRLTTEQVLKAVERVRAGESYATIAIRYGVTSAAIAAIMGGLSWSHVTEIPKPERLERYRDNTNRRRRADNKAKRQS